MKTRAAFLVFFVFTWVSAFAQEPAKVRNQQIAVSVTGEVNHPGAYVLPKGMTVLDAIAAAGNATDDAQLHHVRLIRRVTADAPDTPMDINVKVERKDPSNATILQEGDVLHIPRLRLSYKY